jgi:guanylate kinase
MRRSAIEMCEWNGKNYYFNNRKCFANSMLENGLLECVD